MRLPAGEVGEDPRLIASLPVDGGGFGSVQRWLRRLRRKRSGRLGFACYDSMRDHVRAPMRLSLSSCRTPRRFRCYTTCRGRFGYCRVRSTAPMRAAASRKLGPDRNASPVHAWLGRAKRALQLLATQELDAVQGQTNTCCKTVMSCLLGSWRARTCALAQGCG